MRTAEGALEEAASLTKAIGIDTVRAEIVNLNTATPATFLGTGKVEEIKGWLDEADEVKLVIINTQLSPVQHRNLERAWKAKVLDRTALILEIFGERASTKEGTLQVALAHLTFQKSRLVRSWTHLERQRGGAGFLGGPGERQIESDRRILQDKIDRLKAELEDVRRTRNLQRRKRKRAPQPVVALVGYTNAGKSTLFKRITGEDTFAEDLLFATLDPLMRQIALPSGTPAILSDTVGFISDLPTTLVAAFRATLEEVLEADIVVHVRDYPHPESDAQRADVIKVLAELGLTEDTDAVFIEAWNKIDNLSSEGDETLPSAAGLRGAARARAEVAEGTPNDPLTVAVSAMTGEGVDELLALIDQELTAFRVEIIAKLSADAGEAAAWLYRHGDVIKDEWAESGSRTLAVRLEHRDVGRFEKTYAISLSGAFEATATMSEKARAGRHS
ncbi:MAG: GTPase HflX [Pseudomonadota bacterium]